jgi:hypothetical protein
MGLSMWLVPRCYKQGTKLFQLSSARETVKRGPERISTVRAVARARLVTTHQAGIGLVTAVLICELCRLAVALELLSFRVVYTSGQ